MEIFPVFGKAFHTFNPKKIDLSSSNQRLISTDLSEEASFKHFIEHEKEIAGSNCLWGGYFEERIIYKRSELFGITRNIHLGIDVWLPENTAVYAPTQAVVINTAFHPQFGDYGGTAIIKTLINKSPLYILYGHLSADIVNLKKGVHLHKGQYLGGLGNWNENGNWPPHLHIQCMHDFDEMLNDYPGVCDKEEISFYMKKCANPEFLL